MPTVFLANTEMINAYAKKILPVAVDLLRHEYYLQRVSQATGDFQNLPRRVQQDVVNYTVKSYDDGRYLVQNCVDLYNYLEEVGELDQCFLKSVEYLQTEKSTPLGKLLSSLLTAVGDLAPDYHLAVETLKPAASHLSVLDTAILSAESDKIFINVGERRIAITKDNPTPLNLVDGARFSAGLHRAFGEKPENVIDGVPHISSRGAILRLSKMIVEEHKARVEEVRLEPEKGVPPQLVILLIIVVVTLGAWVVHNKCLDHEINDEFLCIVALIVAILGPVLACLILVGYPGIFCTVAVGWLGNDDQGVEKLAPSI